MATLSHSDIAKAIFLATKGKLGLAMHETVKNSVKMLAKRNLISKQKGILEHLKNLVNQENGVAQVRVWTKHKLTPDTKKHIENMLREKYGKKEFEFLETIDPSLLGGFKIKVKDEMFDLTLRSQIHKLQEYLTREL